MAGSVPAGRESSRSARRPQFGRPRLVAVCFVLGPVESSECRYYTLYYKVCGSRPPLPPAGGMDRPQRRTGPKAPLRGELALCVTSALRSAHPRQQAVTFLGRQEPWALAGQRPPGPDGAGFAAHPHRDTEPTKSGSPDAGQNSQDEVLRTALLPHRPSSDSCPKTLPIPSETRPARASTPPGRRASRPTSPDGPSPRGT